MLNSYFTIKKNNDLIKTQIYVFVFVLSCFFGCCFFFRGGVNILFSPTCSQASECFQIFYMQQDLKIEDYSGFFFQVLFTSPAGFDENSFCFVLFRI